MGKQKKFFYLEAFHWELQRHPVLKSGSDELGALFFLSQTREEGRQVQEWRPHRVNRDPASFHLSPQLPPWSQDGQSICAVGRRAWEGKSTHTPSLKRFAQSLSQLLPLDISLAGTRSHDSLWYSGDWEMQFSNWGCCHDEENECSVHKEEKLLGRQ